MSEQGGGGFAAQALRMGLSVQACEYSATGRGYAKRKGVDIHPFDLTKESPSTLTGQFDLAFSFEVAEHLPPSMGDRLVAFLADRAPLIVFTAAHPGQLGSGHINEQPKTYWIERFEGLGTKHDPVASADLARAFEDARVSSWFADNVLVFRR